MAPKTPNEMISETHDTVIEIKTALFGMSGSKDEGICGKVNDVKLQTQNHETRIAVIENNCRKALCDAGITETGTEQPIKPTRRRFNRDQALGATGGISIIALIYIILKAVVKSQWGIDI